MFIQCSGKAYWATRDLDSNERLLAEYGTGRAPGEILVLVLPFVWTCCELIKFLFTRNVNEISWRVFLLSIIIWAIANASRGFRRQRFERLITSGLLRRTDEQPFKQLLLLGRRAINDEPWAVMNRHMGIVNEYLQDPYVRHFSRQANTLRDSDPEKVNALQQIDFFAAKTLQQLADAEMAGAHTHT